MIWLALICVLSILFYFMHSTNFNDGRTAGEKMSDAWLMLIALCVAFISSISIVVWMIIKVSLL